MNYFKMLIFCGLVPLFFIGCGGSDDSGSKTSSVSSYVHEREFAKDSDFFAQPDQVVVLNLETADDSVSDDEDTGGIGDDVIRIRLEEAAGHEFKLNIPDGDLFTMTVTGPAGYVEALLDKDNPSATVDVDEGVHSFAITHGGGTVRNRALFIRPGSTIVSKDCPGCNLSGINLQSHNLSGSDMTGADLSYADLSYANLEYADVTDSVRQGTNMENAVVTGIQGTYPAPKKGDCPFPNPATKEAMKKWTTCHDGVYTVTPTKCSKDNYAAITFCQCDKGSDGSPTNVSPNCLKIGPNSGAPPVSIQLVDDGYYYVTVDNYTKQPFNCFIHTTNEKGWNYAGTSCSKSSPIQPKTTCGGCQCIDSSGVGSKGLNTLCKFNSSTSLLDSRFYLLDKQNGNLLFRGPTPCKEEDKSYTFDYQNVMKNFQDRYKKQVGDGKFPDKIIFLDISLISNAGDQGLMLAAEYEFFGGTGKITDLLPHTSQPQGDGNYHDLPTFTTKSGQPVTVQGQFWWWYMPPELKGAQSSQIDELAQKIGDWMATDNTGEGAFHYVIYIHCHVGCDRTGEVAISYLLKNKNMSSEEAYIYGSTIFQLKGTSWVRGRLIPNGDYLIGAAWYNCRLCNNNSPLCVDLTKACPACPECAGGISPCSDCKSKCPTCTTELTCWDFSDIDSVPGDRRYPNYPNTYPWSTTSWGPACGQ
jgi:hypothetical protein